ncbi:hypothetical protein SERLA73DRAFT_189365, partial [Serpula lacrymans var. lacrymans S7.3]
MQLLGGFFKRDKSNTRNVQSSVLPAPDSTTSIGSSSFESPEDEFVFPEKSLPHHNGVYTGVSASSSKLKLPFRRKPAQQHRYTDPGLPVVSLNDAPLRPPPVPYISSAASDIDHSDLPQPPPKSSLFGTHSDPNVSTRSLPDGHPQHSFHSNLLPLETQSETHTTSSSPPPPPPPKKSGGLFSWARERTKSKPVPPTPTPLQPSSPAYPGESFNLKSFRHVRPESPTKSPIKPSNV